MIRELPNPDSTMIANGEFKCLGHGEKRTYEDCTDRGLADLEYCGVECVELHVAALRRINAGEYDRGYEVGRKLAEYRAGRDRMRMEDDITEVRTQLEAAKRAIGESQDLLPALTESLALARRSA